MYFGTSFIFSHNTIKMICKCKYSESTIDIIDAIDSLLSENLYWDGVSMCAISHL